MVEGLLSPLLIAALSLILLLVLLAIGTPIAVSLAATGFVGLVLLRGVDIAINPFGLLPFSTVATWTLIVVPLFVLMGELAYGGRISEDAFRASRNWLGHLPGGLAISAIAACAAFACACGSSMATAVTMGRLSIPQMKKAGYDDRLATGSVAAGGLLGIMIPPSVPFVIYGLITDESIGRLLIAGIIPGICTAIIFGATVFLQVKKNPAIAPVTQPAPWKDKVDSLKTAWSPFVLFFIVIGGIYFGVFTPTEAAAAGALAAFIFVLFRAKKRFSVIKTCAADTARTTGMIFMIFIGAAIFSMFINLSGLPAWLVELATSLAAPRIVTLSLILLVYIPLGMFLDPMSMILITLPLTYPIVKALGFSGIWFGVMIVKMIEIANITPPVGLNVYVIKGIAPEVPIESIFRGISWFIVAEIVVVVLLVAFPQLALWLPAIAFD